MNPPEPSEPFEPPGPADLTALDDAALEGRLHRAHAAGDAAVLARLFAEAARRADEPAAERFLLTQAHALGLGAGLEATCDWHARLVALGAETPVARGAEAAARKPAWLLPRSSLTRR